MIGRFAGWKIVLTVLTPWIHDYHRDGHDTDTKYRYCRYLRVGGKYRYSHQVSIVSILRPRCLCPACLRKNTCCQI